MRLFAKYVRPLLLTAVLAVGLLAAGCGDNGANSGGGTFDYGGQTYRTVVIGGKRWMAENLNVETADSWCYNCYKYGRLYSWTAAKSACPNGWHLSTRQDWRDLVKAAGGAMAGTKLKSKSGWNETYNGADGTDDYGFSALPGGGRDKYGFDDVGKAGVWWAAAASSDEGVYFWWYMENDNFDVTEKSGDGYDFVQSLGLSVRCVKD